MSDALNAPDSGLIAEFDEVLGERKPTDPQVQGELKQLCLDNGDTTDLMTYLVVEKKVPVRKVIECISKVVAPSRVRVMEAARAATVALVSTP
jgi:hypothetical protein